MANTAADIASKTKDLAGGMLTRVLESGKAILDPTADAISNSRGILGTIARLKGGPGAAPQTFNRALKEAYTQGTANPGETINWGTVAGSYIGAASAYRGLSGGGAYRDASGNTDIIGVPFV